MLKEVFVPDIGAHSNVDIIEVLVVPGDVIEKDASILTLETDKATVEVPAPFAGLVKNLHVKVGDKVSQHSLIVTLETADNTDTPIAAVSASADKSDISATGVMSASLPKNAPFLAQQPLIAAAISTAQMAQDGDKVDTHRQPVMVSQPVAANEVTPRRQSAVVHAGPGVRRFARELGVDLARIDGTGSKNRIVKQDVQAYVKTALAGGASNSLGGGITVAPWPTVDFAKFGEITQQPLSRIKKLSGSYLHRNWMMVPHVTQFDEVDITDLEKFRKNQQPLADRQGIKLTVAAFIMKAVTASLKAFPTLNASLEANGASLILKKYFHIGVAVDTPNGLMVPVVRDVDQKGLLQLAKELAEISARARQGQLTAEEMQGSSFTVSSLGGIGGTAFTPIINVPDVAILGISKAQIKPVYIEGEFKPRLLLPLSLSYDHRVIDGAEAARFTTFLVEQLSDIRRWAL